MGQWIAPTLNPEELEKRIGELKTVQFWLEQNARMIGVTIQALEVQRMTLSTLQTMNLPMADLRNALTLPTAAPAPARRAGAGTAAPQPEPARAGARAPAAAGASRRGRPDAMVGRADPAVHRTGHQGHAGQQRPRRAQPGRRGQATPTPRRPKKAAPAGQAARRPRPRASAA